MNTISAPRVSSARSSLTIEQPELVLGGQARAGFAGQPDIFVGEQPALGREAAREAGQRSVAADHPMAGDDDRDRVAAVGAADRSRGPGRGEHPRLLAVAAGLAERDPGQRRPGLALELAADCDEPKVELAAVAVEVLAHLHGRLRASVARDQPRAEPPRQPIDPAAIAQAHGREQLAVRIFGDREVHGHLRMKQGLDSPRTRRCPPDQLGFGTLDEAHVRLHAHICISPTRGTATAVCCRCEGALGNAARYTHARAQFDLIPSPGQNHEVPRPRTTGIRGSAGVLSALLLGCCCTTSPPQAAGPAQADDSVRETEAGATEAGIDVGDHDEVLPAYNPEALAARYDAQRALLGDESLFEDIEGNPVTPTIAPQVGGELGSIDDDILLSLPGSAGFGLDGTAREEAVANGNALGLYVPIENPRSGPALAHFHEALRKLEAGEDEDGKVRVLVYGASHTQADVYPGYLRAYLQARFGNGGQGFVSVVKVNKWFRYADWNIEESKGWICEHA